MSVVPSTGKCCGRLYNIISRLKSSLVYFSFLPVDEIQVASYKMLGSLFTLGTDGSLTGDR
jgi:hypothetical protein